MSDYTTWAWLKLVLQNIIMLTAGGLGTIPWLSRQCKGKLSCIGVLLMTADDLPYFLYTHPLPQSSSTS